jgi:hypothetical protein
LQLEMAVTNAVSWSGFSDRAIISFGPFLQ